MSKSKRGLKRSRFVKWLVELTDAEICPDCKLKFDSVLVNNGYEAIKPAKQPAKHDFWCDKHKKDFEPVVRIKPESFAHARATGEHNHRIIKREFEAYGIKGVVTMDKELFKGRHVVISEGGKVQMMYEAEKCINVVSGDT